MASRRTLLALLIGAVVLAQPIYGVGPGPETQYQYKATPVDFSDHESVGAMYELPAVEYGTGVQLEAVRQAANATVSYDIEDVPPDLRTLTDARFLADDFEDQYYRVDTRIGNGTVRLNATPVTASVVADELALAPDRAPDPIQRVVDGETMSRSEAPPTLVATDDRLLVVQPVESEQVPDPYAIPKLVAYALAFALILWALVAVRLE